MRRESAPGSLVVSADGLGFLHTSQGQHLHSEGELRESMNTPFSGRTFSLVSVSISFPHDAIYCVLRILNAL